MCCNEKKAQGLGLIDDTIYKKPWFWVCITVIVFCIMRPHVIVMCGNGSGNQYNGKDKKD